MKPLALVSRVLLPLFVLLVALPAALLLVGRHADGRASISARAEIARPADEVFPFLVEQKQLTLWVRGLDHVTELTEGGVRPGAKLLFIYVEPRRRTAMRWEIVELDPPRRLVLRGTNSSVDAEAAWELQQSNGRTELSYRADLRYKTALSRLLAARTARSEEERLRGDLEKLKRILEGRRRTDRI